MYWKEIFHYLTLPLLIYITYRIILFVLKKFDLKIGNNGE